MLIIIPCGSKKRLAPSPARDLYLGAQFRMTVRAAEALQVAAGGRIMILSGLHGLLELDQVVEPYEQRMGKPGCVSVEQLRAKAVAMGLELAEDVTVLAGKEYSEAARAVWPAISTPLAGLGGIGYQRQALARIIREGKLPELPE